MLLADWQIIADLSFADLVLWLPAADGSGYWAGAQMRPTTGPTAFVDDIVGSFLGAGRRPLLDAAAARGPDRARGRPGVARRRAGARRGDPGTPRRPVDRGRRPQHQPPGRAYAEPAGAVLPADRHRALPDDRAAAPSRSPASAPTTPTPRAWATGSSASTRDGAGDLRQPQRAVGLPQARADRRPRRAVAGRADPRARAGPAAARRGDHQRGARRPPAARHRARQRPSATRDPARDPAAARPASTSAALVLLRDVTELRRRDRELVTKDATIREIHHRVKNNLQTVAALLRLQARRIGVPEGRVALEEAVRRVGAIAVVHETLSQAFDECGRLRRGGRPARPGWSPTSRRRASPVRTRREGSFGTVVLRRGHAAGDGASPS